MTYYVDTNYFLRFFLDDNEKQTQIVRELFDRASNEEVNLISSIVVFLEVYWVLRSFYKFSKIQIIEVLEVVLKMDFIKFHDEEIILNALELFKAINLDLEDCFHLSYVKNSESINLKLATFDKKLKNNI